MDIRKTFSLTGLAVASASCCALAGAQGFGPAVSAARETKPIIDFRLRSESVDQTGINEEARALTLRGRLGFETGKAWNTSLLAEADLVWPLDTDYNSTTNGHTAYPVVVDPETYEINRLQLTNTSIPNTTVIAGRQRLIFDDHRFVANVGWRQNEQTYDSLHVINRSIPNVTLDVAYVTQVNRVFSKESPVGRYEGDNYFFNASWQSKVGKLTGFLYLTDFEEAPTDSTQTVGVRFAGERALRKIKLAYAVSFAIQEDRADNPLNYSANYSFAELTGTLRQYSLGVGYEVLEGDGVKGFSTPLATLHKFQGWADKFLTTPADGIEDRYVTVGYTKKGVGFLDTVSASAAWHDFEAERTSVDYGTELNLQLQAKYRRFSGALKYADYRADRFATDTRKWWAQIEFIW